MLCTIRKLLIGIMLFSPAAWSLDLLSDSLYIEGNFKQGNETVSRRSVEKFLLEANSSMIFMDKSKGYWWSSWAVGATMWTVNTGYSLYQANLVYDAIKKQDTLSLINANFNRFAIPLVIGSEICGFVQGILRNRSDYWFHKAVTAFNGTVARNHPNDTLMDHKIRKTKSGAYMQDRILMPEQIVNPVLRDLSASRPYAYWSDATGFLGDQAIGIGGMFIVLAVLSYLDQRAADAKTRDTQLTLGISITSFGIINDIVSFTTRKAGIRRYNEAIAGSR